MIDNPGLWELVEDEAEDVISIKPVSFVTLLNPQHELSAYYIGADGRITFGPTRETVTEAVVIDEEDRLHEVVAACQQNGNDIVQREQLHYRRKAGKRNRGIRFKLYRDGREARVAIAAQAKFPDTPRRKKSKPQPT